MRAVVWLILLAIVAVVAAALLGDNHNVVTLYWAPWRVDLSFNLFIVGLLALFFVINALINAVSALVGLPRRAHLWRVARRDRSAQAALRESLAQYFGGRYSRAQKAAQRAVAIQADTPELSNDHEFTVLGHLLAAGSAHRLQDRARRDEQLDRALDLAGRSLSARSAEAGARLLAAEWALEDRDAARTLELLSELPPGVARRTYALRLKLQAARLSEQPLEALKTARLLAKHQAFSPSAAQGLLRSLAFEALDGARDADQVRRIWRDLDAADRRDVYVAARASARMRDLGLQDEARAWLRPLWDRIGMLSREDREVLALALASNVEGIGADWVAKLESAWQAHPREGALAYAAGSALIARALWGKARQTLQLAVEDPTLPAHARRDAWLRLAEMSERDGHAERAADELRHAAQPHV